MKKTLFLLAAGACMGFLACTDDNALYITPDIPDTGEITAPDQPQDPQDPGQTQDPEQPGQPQDPDDPQNPEQPDDPQNPEQPENPQNPEQPENPQNPEQPENPQNPEQPENPQNPEQPENPQNPEQPENPQNPEQPENPQNPEQPENPQNPEQPENPQNPEQPEVPLEGCANPANEGKSCDNQETRPCAVSVCRAGSCVSVAVTDQRICRNATGVCDIEERCDGSTLDCPADKFKSGDVCRQSAGVCDKEEQCNGSSPDCPADQFKSGDVCRQSAGVCDVEERCNGSSPNCPADQFKSGDVCRQASGDCDVEERCNGSSAACPADAKRPSSYVCRKSAGGCDAAEKCDGSSNKCPSDAFDSNCTCPNGSGTANYVTKFSHSKLVLQDKDQWNKYTNIIDSLGLAKLSPHELSFNRTMQSMPSKTWVGFKKGWFWESGDCSVSYWIPQGLAGGGSGGKTIRVVGWHYDEDKASSDSNPAADETDKDKGVRISFIDTTDTKQDIKYRHVLLVEPDADRGFKPVKNHVGGLVWYWPYLYVADTGKGMRVFDLQRILKVDTSSACDRYVGKHSGKYCAYGYAYALPQVNAYFYPGTMHDTCKPKFSFIGLETINGQKSILSGEYVKDGNNGRLVRWPAGSGGKLQTNDKKIVEATGAWYAGSPNLQGGLTFTSGKTYFLLNSTKGYGTLYVGAEGTKTKSYTSGSGKWTYMPEGMYLTSNDNIWVSTEGHTSLKRGVFYAAVKDML